MENVSTVQEQARTFLSLRDGQRFGRSGIWQRVWAWPRPDSCSVQLHAETEMLPTVDVRAVSITPAVPAMQQAVISDLRRPIP